MTRSVQALAAVVVVLAAFYVAPGSPASAQRPTQPPGTGTNIEQLKRYGTRLALAVPSAALDPHTTLRVANAGRQPTHLAMIEIGAPPAASCPTRDTAPILRYQCDGLALAPLALTELTLYHADVAAANARNMVVYSIAPDRAVAACQQLQAVHGGRLTLAEWERTAWAPGEPVAVLAHTVSQGAESGLAGEVTVGVAGIGAGRPDRPGLGGLRPVLPATWRAGEGGAALALNVGTECATFSGRSGTSDRAPCSPAGTTSLQVAGLSTQALSLSGPGPHGLAGQATGEVVLAAGRRAADGWWTYAGAGSSNESGGVAFPLAVGPLLDTTAELYVANVNVTATAKVELVMFDGNQGLQKLYTDPVPLCAGGTRRYDIHELAGEIPPTSGGRPGTEGPPMLSLRLQGTSDQTQQAPMLAGVMVIHNGQGVTAYGGLANSVGTQVFQAIRRLQPGLSVWTVVPGVRKNAGPDRRTTLLAIQTLGNPQAENGAYVDLYDATGNRVASEIQVRLGDGPAGFLDLGAARARLPDGFVGTAVVRGVQNRGTLAVVAMERAAAPGAGDTLVAWPGVILPRWPDPGAATPTPRPTRETPTPDLGRGTRTATPTARAATATPTKPITTPPAGPALFFPHAMRHRVAANVGRQGPTP